jgi:hypothetical protein
MTTPTPEPDEAPLDEQIDDPHSDAAQRRSNDMPAGVSETAVEEEVNREELP